MKKAISILLAVATLAFATTAMAAVTTTTDVATGNVAGTQYARSASATFVADAGATSTMPCFRPGDTVSFTINGGVSADDDITLITYKVNESPSDASVQYIQQYEATGDTQAVAYKVRDLASGVYRLDIKVGSNDLKTVYYKIGNVSAKMLATTYSDSGTNGSVAGDWSSGSATAYVIKDRGEGNYSIGFVGKVTVDAANITLADIGSTPGFRFNNGKEYKFGTGVNAGLSAGALVSDTVEISGGYSYVYGMTIYNVPSAQTGTITATAITE